MGENISGPVPATADSLFAKAACSSTNHGEGKQTATNRNKANHEERTATDAAAKETRAIEGIAPPARGGGAAATGGAEQSLRGGTAIGGGGSRGKSGRRQLAVFPYEHPSPIATTFDVTFHLPDVGLVAHADPASSAAAPAGGGGGGGCNVISDAVEVGEVRSTLLTWRMLR